MELHQIISAEDPEALLEKQNAFLASHPDFTLSFRRYFLSCREQKDLLLSSTGICGGIGVEYGGQSHVLISETGVRFTNNTLKS